MPDTRWVHGWHTKFAQFLCMLMPLSFTLITVWKKVSLKITLAISLAISVAALVLSTARGGYFGFIGVFLVWALYLSEAKGSDIKKLISYFIVIVMVTGFISISYLPGVRERLLKTYTPGLRIELWKTGFHAIEQRPLLG